MSTLVNLVPVQSALFSTALSLLIPISLVLLKTNYEGDGLIVSFVEVEGTGFKNVALALLWPMLADDLPSSVSLPAVRVAPGVEVEVTDIPKVRDAVGLLQLLEDEFSAFRTNGLEIEVDLYFLTVL